MRHSGLACTISKNVLGAQNKLQVAFGVHLMEKNGTSRGHRAGKGRGDENSGGPGKKK